MKLASKQKRRLYSVQCTGDASQCTLYSVLDSEQTRRLKSELGMLYSEPEML